MSHTLRIAPGTGRVINPDPAGEELPDGVLQKAMPALRDVTNRDILQLLVKGGHNLAGICLQIRLPREILIEHMKELCDAELVVDQVVVYNLACRVRDNKVIQNILRCHGLRKYSPT